MTPFVDSAIDLAWAQTWQVFAVMIVSASLAWMIGKRRPHLAYLLWMLVLVKALTPPVFSGPVSIFSWSWTAEKTVSATVDTETSDVIAQHSSPQVASQADGEADGETARRASARPAVSWTSGFVGLWMCGTLLVILFHGVAHVRFRQRLARASEEPGEELIAQVAALAKRVGLRRSPQIVLTSLPMSPAVFGVRRPLIVLPKSILRDGASHNLETVLAHELIHVRRGDPPHALLQLAGVSLWWWNPCVWLASRSATRERERCCDEEVLGTLEYPPEFYAQCMLDMLRAQVRPTIAAGSLALTALPVTRRRLESIMNPGRRFHRQTPRWQWAAAIVLGLILLPGGKAAEQAVPEPDTLADAPDAGGLNPPTKTPELVCMAWQAKGATSRDQRALWNRQGDTLSPQEARLFLKQVESVTRPGEDDQLPSLYLVFRVDERIRSGPVMPAVIFDEKAEYGGAHARDWPQSSLIASSVQPNRSLTLQEWPKQISLEINYPIDNETIIKTITTIPDQPVEIVPGVRWYLDPERARDRDNNRRVEGKTAAVLEIPGHSVEHAWYRARVFLREKEEPVAGGYITFRGSPPNYVELRVAGPIESKDQIERVEITCQHFRKSRIDDVPLRLDLLPK